MEHQRIPHSTGYARYGVIIQREDTGYHKYDLREWIEREVPRVTLRSLLQPGNWRREAAAFPT